MANLPSVNVNDAPFNEDEDDPALRSSRLMVSYSIRLLFSLFVLLCVVLLASVDCHQYFTHIAGVFVYASVVNVVGAQC